MPTSSSGFHKPLLKWPGGKRWLVPYLKERWDAYAKTNSQSKKTIRLVEPFMGGMSVALGLNPSKALLNDANEHVVNFYQQVKNGFEISKRFVNSKEYYYKTRDRFNALIRTKKHLTAEAAALFYFLIRTGYNGLCRFNNAGEFNVPFGSHVTIRYRTQFLEYQPILQPWEMTCQDFEQLILKPNDFIYADPPYDVEFTKYNKLDFKWEDQCRLAEWLSQHPGPVIASNQATDRIIKLYKDYGFEIFIVEAPRSISCTGDRSAAKEVLAFKGINLPLKTLT
jgi:DNA adenine methylase